MDEFAGKVALISGAGRGAGREIALAFASLGVSVAANDINPINLEATVSQIQQAGGIARSYVFDVAKRMPIEAMLAQVLGHFGRIDILVNHAAVEPDAYLLEMDEWELHRTLDVNLAGPFFCIQQVGRIMRQQGGGTMVNILTATEPLQGQKGHSAYLASQAGLLGLTRAAAHELSVHHIRLNAVCSGARRLGLPPMQDWDWSTYHRWRESSLKPQPVDTSGLVSLVLFSCSQAAASLSGQVLCVDQLK